MANSNSIIDQGLGGSGGGGLAFDAKVAAGSASDPLTSFTGIEAAIAAAGIGGTVIFDKDYLIASSFRPLAGQLWLFWGGKFLVDDQIHAAVTSGTVVATDVTVTVSTGNAALFFVGQGISINDGDAAALGTFSSLAHEITGIDLGTGVITFTPAVGTIFNGSNIPTPQISSACRPIEVLSGVDNVRVIGADVNGNQSNFTYAKWSPHRCISVAASCENTLIDYPRVISWAGDAFIVGGRGTVINNPYVEDIGGNGYHYSGGNLTTGMTVHNPVALNVQTRVGAVEHNHGFLSYSTNTGKTITNNPQFYGSAKGGIGGFSDRTNSLTKILGGYMAGVDNGELLHMSAPIAANNVSDIEITGMTIEGYGDVAGADENRITLSGPSALSSTITAITKANPCVVTSAGHPHSVGDTVRFKNAGGMVEINDRVGIVTAEDTNTVTVALNTGGFTTYTGSAGTISTEVSSNLCNVKFTGNTLINCHGSITNVSDLTADNDWRWGGTAAQVAIVNYANISSGVITDKVRGGQFSYILSGENWGDVVIRPRLYQCEELSIKLQDFNDASSISLGPRIVHDGGLTAVTITGGGADHVVGDRFTLPIEKDSYLPGTSPKEAYTGALYSANGRVTRVSGSGAIEAVMLESHGAGYNKSGFGSEPVVLSIDFDTGIGTGATLTGRRQLPACTVLDTEKISSGPDVFAEWTGLNLFGFEMTQHYAASGQPITVRVNNDDWVFKDIVAHMNNANPLTEVINNFSSNTQVINCGANRTKLIAAAGGSGRIVLDTVTGVDTTTFSAFEIA